MVSRWYLIKTEVEVFLLDYVIHEKTQTENNELFYKTSKAKQRTHEVNQEKNNDSL